MAKAGGAPLDPMLKVLAEREDELVAFARHLIATPSPNPPGDERAVADAVVSELDRLGITDVETVGAEAHRPNVVATVGSSSAGHSLILSGHLDTKPAGDLTAWHTDPWDPVVADGELVGLGSGDMKAAVAAMVYAAAAVAEAGIDSGQLRLVFTADEEAGSILGSKWLAEHGHLAADAAVIGEPSGITDEWESLHLVSRGAALFKVRVRGTQMHSSVTDRLPSINATVKMAELISRMSTELKSALTYRGHPLGGLGPTVNVGVMVSGGVYYGVCPGEAEFACDVRTLPGMQRDEFERDVRRFLEQAMSDDPDLHAELDLEVWVPATEIGPEEAIVGALQRAATDVLGRPPRLDAFPGATDAPHFQLGAGIPTVAAFGPGLLPRAHSPNESLALASVGQAARIYALASADFLTRSADHGRTDD